MNFWNNHNLITTPDNSSSENLKHYRTQEQNLKALIITELQVTLETIIHMETEISNRKLRKSDSSNTNDECSKRFQTEN
jgi:CRISPR/Cas system-associated protein endoribonuclease Cas2